MPVVTIAIAGAPAWAAALAEKLGADYTLDYHTQREGYVARLTDTRAALLLVDGRLDDWRFWTATPKASPATRRVPVILVSDTAETRRAALTAGADLGLSPGDLLRQLPQLIADYAYHPSPETLARLDCECQQSLPPLALEGVAQFNAGAYYRQHDLFEEQWVNTPGPARDLYRAILQVGVAYYQIERGNYRGALKMLLRSVQWLAVLPDVCQGVDVRQLREDSYRVRAELERLGEGGIAQFDRRLIKPLRLIDS